MNKQEKQKTKRPDKYEKSPFIIKGTFDDVLSAAFIKDKKPPKKAE